MCKDGHCCTPNRCGFCGQLPREICNGIDDDCDGIVDNPDEIGVGPLCPEQQGACQGATADCHGASGWGCDDSTYARHNPSYSPSEIACDGIDNNCNGQTDEVACPPPADPCLLARCTPSGCGTSDAPLGTPCPGESPNPAFAPLAFCNRGTCALVFASCACTAGVGCTHSNVNMNQLVSTPEMSCDCSSTAGISLEGTDVNGQYWYNVNGAATGACICETLDNATGPWACY
jgi:hypothetical protein